MNISLFSIGKTKQSAYAALEQEYAKRVKFPWKLDIRYFKNEPILLQAIHDTNAIIIALDEKGKEMHSNDFAQYLQEKEQLGESVVFVLGDTDGLPESMKEYAQDTIALSRMTFPHELARVVLLEQLYRAQTILAGHPYHK